MAILGADLTGDGRSQYFCDACTGKIEAEKYRAETERTRRLIELSRNVLVTTTPNIDGRRVKEYLGIESVEFVIGTGVFSEVSSSVADFFGARSSAFEKKLRQAKTVAMDSLKYLAAERGADAVVGIDLDYTEFTGNRIALIINGTLVAPEPVTGPPE